MEIVGIAWNLEMRSLSSPTPIPAFSEASLQMEMGKRGPRLQQNEGVSQRVDTDSQTDGFKDNL